METPDPPNGTPGALKQVVLTSHDIPWSLRVSQINVVGEIRKKNIRVDFWDKDVSIYIYK